MTRGLIINRNVINGRGRQKRGTTPWAGVIPDRFPGDGGGYNQTPPFFPDFLY